MTSTGILKIRPRDIERESFRIISEELGPTAFDPQTYQVVQRVIHASGDFSFAGSLRFHPAALASGIAAIRAGGHILTDVNMCAAGISQGLLKKWGGRVICRVAEPGVASLARELGRTRSEVAVEQGLEADDIGIVAVGNAPTALLRVMACLERMGERLPLPLVVGVPVGFVNAAEAKEILAGRDYPFITAVGRKGGSPIAAAIVNALIRLALEE